MELEIKSYKRKGTVFPNFRGEIDSRLAAGKVTFVAANEVDAVILAYLSQAWTNPKAPMHEEMKKLKVAAIQATMNEFNVKARDGEFIAGAATVAEKK